MANITLVPKQGKQTIRGKTGLVSYGYDYKSLQ